MKPLGRTLYGLRRTDGTGWFVEYTEGWLFAQIIAALSGGKLEVVKLQW
jgi:hypothetical protein